MKLYRAEIHNHIVELRKGDLGGEQVLVNGRIISDRPWAGWHRPSHFFELTDEQSTLRHVEVRLVDTSRFGLGKYRAIISVDGVERCRLEPIDPAAPPYVCGNCGYSLTGLPIENGEVRCPECGRHTMAPPESAMP